MSRKSWHQNFWEKVVAGDPKLTPGCWIWIGGIQKDGYGRCSPGPMKGSRLAHIRAYEQIKGHIPEGLVLDHLCRRRHCVNPDHLEPVTNEENVRRGISVSVVNSRKTHCRQGHPFEGDNLIVRSSGGRSCRACQREADRKRSSKRKGYQKGYRQAHQSDLNQYNREWYKKNRDKVLAELKTEESTKKRRARENKRREPNNARRRELYHLNPTKHRLRNKAWREKNPEKYLISKQAWREKQKAE